MNYQKILDAFKGYATHVHDSVSYEISVTQAAMVCAKCGDFKGEHGGQIKCLFGSTYFQPATQAEVGQFIQIALLNEMKFPQLEYISVDKVLGSVNTAQDLQRRLDDFVMVKKPY